MHAVSPTYTCTYMYMYMYTHIYGDVTTIGTTLYTHMYMYKDGGTKKQEMLTKIYNEDASLIGVIGLVSVASRTFLHEMGITPLISTPFR